VLENIASQVTFKMAGETNDQVTPAEAEQGSQYADQADQQGKMQQVVPAGSTCGQGIEPFFKNLGNGELEKIYCE
jgi:hypothetical protein